MNDVSPEKLCRALNLTEMVDVISVGWETSRENIPKGGPSFLNADEINKTCRDLGMESGMFEAVVRAAKVIKDDLFVKRLAWHAYWMAFGGQSRHISFSGWPTFEHSPRIPGTLFYVVVSLGAVAKVRDIHAKRGIPSEEASMMLKRIVSVIDRYKKRHGTYGFPLSSFNYFIHFFNGELFHLGRLQLHYNPFNGRLKAYRHIVDGTVIALSEPDVMYRRDGELFVEHRGDSLDGVWTSSFVESVRSVTGHPITPMGKALTDTATLDKRKWVCVLQRKDDVLQLHIPGSKKLDFDECGASLRQADQFFTRYFPERSFRAFSISSWLMDDQLQQMLSPHSNLVRFQKELYRYPTRGTTQSALRWIFGTPPEDLTKAPRDTSLRRQVIDHVLAGGDMVGGGSFLLADDLNWGSQTYYRAYSKGLHHMDGVTITSA